MGLDPWQGRDSEQVFYKGYVYGNQMATDGFRSCGKAVGEGAPVKGSSGDVPGVRTTSGMEIQEGWF